jgi:abortive infection bacteriophage resistance protein
LIVRLQAVDYYRLCAYWHPFKNTDDTFKPGTTLDIVWDRYVLDRKLRLLVMDAIERVEIAIRAQLVSVLTLNFGAFAHLDPKALPHGFAGQREEFVQRLRDDATKSREVFVAHFKAKYDEFPDLPLWAASEIMTLGGLLTLFRMAGPKTHKDLARPFGLGGPVLDSWIFTLNYVRNMCAHHSRLLNRTLAIKPVIPYPRHAPEWHVGGTMDNSKIFAVLTLLGYLLDRVAPGSGWKERVKLLFDEHPGVPESVVGCPPGWRSHPLWR